MSEVEGACRIEDVLAHEGAYVATTAGVSMRPLLRDRRDTVVIEPCAGRLAKYDVPLYRRGSDYVLLRVALTLLKEMRIRANFTLAMSPALMWMAISISLVV